MNLRDHHGAFADGAAHTLDRARTHVTDREYARKARLERIGFPPACRARKTAACPAELPPPTSTTSAPAHIFASIAEAQYHTPRPSNSLNRGTSGRRYRAPLAITTVRARSVRPSRNVRPNSPPGPA